MDAKPTAYPILGHKHSNGDARNRTEDWKKRRRETTYLSPPKRGRSLGNKMKNIKETSNNLSLDNTILPCKLSHFLAIYLQISPKNLRKTISLPFR